MIVSAYPLPVRFILACKDFPSCVIRSSELKTAGIKKGKEGLIIEHNDGQFIICGKYTLVADPINTPFPDTQSIYQSTVNHKIIGYVGLSAFVIKKLHDGLRQSKNDMVCIALREHDELPMVATPLEFCSVHGLSGESSGELTGLLMPIYIKPNEYKWATKNMKPTEKKSK